MSTDLSFPIKTSTHVLYCPHVLCNKKSLFLPPQATYPLLFSRLKWWKIDKNGGRYGALCGSKNNLSNEKCKVYLMITDPFIPVYLVGNLFTPQKEVFTLKLEKFTTLAGTQQMKCFKCRRQRLKTGNIVLTKWLWNLFRNIFIIFDVFAVFKKQRLSIHCSLHVRCLAFDLF